MPITAQLHDGTRLEFPDGTPDEVINRTVQQVLTGNQGGASSAPSGGAGQPQQRTPMQELRRQVGLTARYGLEGVGQALDVLHEPIRGGYNALASATGLPTADSSLGQMAHRAANALSLPEPETATERVVGDASRMVAGTGSMIGAGRGMAQSGNALVQAVGKGMQSRPGAQLVGSASGGATSGAVREGGGSPLEQLIGGVAGAVAGTSLFDAGRRATQSVVNALTPRATQLDNAEHTIRLVYERSGLDWSAVPEKVKQGMRDEVANALATGKDLDPAAVRRLAVMQEAGVKPTVGQLTQDPAQLTREVNLAKAGANSGNPALHKLAALQNQNTGSLLQRLDEAGAKDAPGAYQAGAAVIGDLKRKEYEAKGLIGDLYERARNATGRDVELDGHAFTKAANDALKQNLAPKLGPEVDAALNDIATGKTPLTVEYAEQLKTMLGRKARAAQGTQGDLAYAYGLVRKALDAAPLKDAGPANPGNLPALAGQANPGAQALKDFTDARQAYAQWMQRLEGNPALKAVADGAEPDQFVSKYVVGKSATASDLRALKSELSPESINALKQHLVAHLKDAATGGADDIVRFNGQAYRRALQNIGEEKLGVLFDKEELRSLKNLSEAAKYLQAQPAGTAINNSNSGALVVGRALDALEGVSQKLPLGFKDVISGTIQGAQQSQFLNPRNALVMPSAGVPASQRVNALLPTVVIPNTSPRKPNALSQ